MSPTGTISCGSCGGGLRPGQRYCLHCGTRHGAPRVPPLSVLADAVAGASAASGTGAAATTPAPAVPARPTRRLTAGLAGATLLAGVLTGALLTPGTTPVSAATARGVLAVVEDAPAPAAVTAAPVATTPADDSADTTAAAPSAAAPVAATADPVAETPAASPAPAATDPTAGEEPTGAPTPAPVPATPVPAGLPAIKHVWLITLTGQTAATLFGPAAAATAPYLSGLLPSATLLRGYTPLTSADAAESIALLSGQAPTAQSTAGCPVFSDLQPGTIDPATGLAAGDGCVYPAGVATLPGQLTAAGRSWRAYVEGAPAPCAHPAPGAPDPTATPSAGDAARTARNPPVFFHALTDGGACAGAETGLGALAGDLAAEDPATVPALSLVVPGPCHDGREQPCAPGAPAGATAADAFLKATIPAITASAAYRDGGLVAVVVAAPPAPGATPTSPPATGALLLSAAVRPGTVLEDPTGPYALLRSLEDLFGLAHLGHAADPTVTAYDSAVYAATSAAAPTTTNPVTTTVSPPNGAHLAPDVSAP